MAYKFQLGPAVMSGSLEQEGNVDITDSGVLQIAGSTLADASRNITAAQVSGSSHLLAGGNLTVAGTVTLAGSADATMVASDGMYFRDADDGLMKREAASDVRDLFFSAVSSDATIASGGALTIANDAITSAKIATGAVVADGIAADAVESGALNDNVISGQTELAHANIADEDELMISDGGTLKKVGVDSLRDHYFGVVSGDATVADGGALTIAANAVEGSMLNSNVVADTLQYSGSALRLSSSVAGAGIGFSSGVLSLDIDELNTGTSLHQTEDHFVFSDNGTEKKITFSNLQDAVFADVSSDATIAAGGALTIANDAITSAKIATGAVVADGIAADAVESGALNDNVISGQTELAHANIADEDELMISDGGTLKKVGVDSLRDHYFGVVSGDATVADGGALTIANDAVTSAKIATGAVVADGIAADAVEAGALNDNVISGQTELALDNMNPEDELLISDGGTLKKIGVDNLFRDGGSMVPEAAITVADDYMLFLDGGATGDQSKESVADFVSAIAGSGIDATDGVLSVGGSQVSGSGNHDVASLIEGFNFANTQITADRTWTLPSTGSVDAGSVVRVKAGQFSGSAKIIVARNGATIDGLSVDLELEAAGAAVSLMYVGGGSWQLF